MTTLLLTAPEAGRTAQQADDDLVIEVANNDRADVPTPDAEGEGDRGGAAAPPPSASGVAQPEPLAQDDLSIALAPIIDPENLATGLIDLFEWVAERRQEPHWELSAREAKAMAVPLSEEVRGLAYAAPFLGDVAGAVGGNRLRLVGVTMGVVGFRWTQSRALRAQRRRTMRSPASPSPTPPPTPAAGEDWHADSPLDLMQPKDLS